MPCGKIPKRKPKTPTGSTSPSLWKLAGYQTQVVPEAGIYQLVVKKR